LRLSPIILAKCLGHDLWKARGKKVKITEPVAYVAHRQTVAREGQWHAIRAANKFTPICHNQQIPKQQVDVLTR